MATVTTLLNQQAVQKEVRFKDNVLHIRNSLLSAITSDSSWMMTRAKNAQMKCVSSSQKFCTPGETERLNIALYDAEGTIIYDSAIPSAGYRMDGTRCDTYSSAGDDSCPLHVSLKWRAQCANSTCSSFEDYISIHFVYTPHSKENKFPFNPANYNVVEQSRGQFGGNDSPVLICARKGMIFIGEKNAFNGQTSDGEGCISYAAFLGPRGPQGPTGPTGPTGATGMMGPQGYNGADAYCP